MEIIEWTHTPSTGVPAIIMSWWSVSTSSSGSRLSINFKLYTTTSVPTNTQYSDLTASPDTIWWTAMISFQTKCCKNQPLGPSIFLNCRNSCSSFLKGEYLKMSSVSVAYFSVSWVRGCWVFTSQLGNGTITYENRPKALRDLLFAQTESLSMMLHQVLTSSRPSSSWNVRDKNKHVNLSSFLVKRMKSFPIRMEPLKETRTFMYKNINNELIGFQEKSNDTYDFNPFPYWPMWVDSGKRLLDLPNWMTWVASPIQNSSVVIIVVYEILRKNACILWYEGFGFLSFTHWGPFQCHHQENTA